MSTKTNLDLSIERYPPHENEHNWKPEMRRIDSIKRANQRDGYHTALTEHCDPLREELSATKRTAVQWEKNAHDIEALGLAEVGRLRGLVQGAKGWWEGFRPVAWTEAQHIAQPRVNMSTEGECLLADLIASYLSKEAGYTPTTP